MLNPQKESLKKSQKAYPLWQNFTSTEVYANRNMKNQVYSIVSRNNSLEACARLLFILLQDFFASASLHRLHKFFFTEVYSILFVQPKTK